MLLMIEKPRLTPAERAAAAARRAGRALSVALAAGLAWPLRTAQNRRALLALAAMGDHELRDIGLVRGDLRDALSLPAGSDGTLFLAGRRTARRRPRA